MRRRALAVVMLLAFTGCAASTPGIGDAAASQLAPQVEQVKAAAMGRDRTRAEAKLAQLRVLVTDLRQRDELSGAGAAEVLAAAAEVEAQLARLAPVRISTTAAPTPTTTEQPPPGSRDGDDNGGGEDGGGDRRKGKAKD